MFLTMIIVELYFQAPRLYQILACTSSRSIMYLHMIKVGMWYCYIDNGVKESDIDNGVKESYIHNGIKESYIDISYMVALAICHLFCKLCVGTQPCNEILAFVVEKEGISHGRTTISILLHVVNSD